MPDNVRPIRPEPPKSRQADAQLAILMQQEAEANERARRQAKLFIVKIPLAIVALLVAMFAWYFIRGK